MVLIALTLNKLLLSVFISQPWYWQLHLSYVFLCLFIREASLGKHSQSSTEIKIKSKKMY